MGGKNNYSENGIYQGGSSNLKSNYGNFTGYRTDAGSFSLTTDPRNANILQEFSSKLSSGVKNIELATVSPEIFDSIPDQYLKEVNRLSKLTGVEISMHAPVLEPSGIGQQGFTESNRQAVENQIWNAVKRSHKLNPKGNINVNFHSSAGIPGEISQKNEKIPEEILIVNEESSSFGKIPLKKRFWPGEKTEIKNPKDRKIIIEKEIRTINEDSWDKQKANLAQNTRYGENIIRESGISEIRRLEMEKRGEHLTEYNKINKNDFNMGKAMLDDSYRQIKGMFETVKRYGNENDLKILNNFAEEITPFANKINKTKNTHEAVDLKIEIIRKGIDFFDKIKNPPKIHKSLTEFSRDKTTETFSNVALNSYEKFKDTSPIIVIENPPAGGAFSTGEGLKEIIQGSREKFVKKAIQKGVLSESEAKKQAKKLIGATWDVGHVNMMRKYGYDSKDLIEETEKIAPFVKHVHLSDNFGFEHTELPMGMGNVPLKEMMKKIGKEGFKGKKVIEAAQWWQHMKAPPVNETLEAFGSPFYSKGQSPYWNQSIGLQQNYSAGYGQIFPQINYETFGGSFSQLPIELGGQRQGTNGSRMGGGRLE